MKCILEIYKYCFFSDKLRELLNSIKVIEFDIIKEI